MPTPSPARRRGRINQVPGLDGLRGVAVTAVVLYHFFGDWLPGGFLGVDVFFVLSGFLITALLLRERAVTGTISLAGFWTRRLRRIVPLAVTVLLVTTVAAGLIGGDAAVKLRTQFLGTALFVNNWVQIAQGQSYFADSGVQVTAHYWSLAIEEQFYVLWPLLVIGLLALGGRSRVRSGALGFVALVAAGASAWWMSALFDPTPGADPSRVYYGTDTHAFGLLIGAFVAVWVTSTASEDDADSFPTYRSFVPGGRTGQWVSGLALLGVVVLMATMSDQSPFAYQGGILLAVVLTAITMAGVLRGDTVVDEWLRVSTLRWLGQRSFSIYLWHWPIVVLAGFLLPPQPSWLPGALAVPLTLVLSEASYRLVENPVRRHGYRASYRWLRAHHPVATAVVAALTAAGVGFALVTAPSTSTLERDLAELERQHTAAAPTTPPRPTPEGARITAVGDSVMLAASDALTTRFPGSTVDGGVSRHYQDGLAILQAMADAGTLGDVVVLGFGTNGPSYGAGDELMLDRIRETVGPDRLLIYVLPYGDRWYMPEAEAELLAEAREHDNVYIADWCHAARDDYSLLRDDYIHPTPPGAVAYAEAIADAIEQWTNHDKVIPDVCGV
ncbi:acyltransferase family protein [Corynebacterium uterequi]|uniref:Putative acyltransferase n=1 Tax=Corynebacterium uterequi TaxID=1072256 RepID=A0A0G3H9V6_9CORY|nr:acyltransferase family protein [Corynebacterium uterequi]AKK10121.1 putative acyltransferase [Corynebacterium uterequi]